MLNSPEVQRALSFATEVHEGQTRKGSDVPYITHPIAVTQLLFQVQANEDVMVAGALHDVVEDCEPYGSVTLAYLATLFSEPAVAIVGDLTEDKELPWEARKLASLQHISEMSHDSLLVKSADVLHNLLSLVTDVENQGIAVYGKFNASKERTQRNLLELVQQITQVWPENPFLPELHANIVRLFEVSGDEIPFFIRNIVSF